MSRRTVNKSIQLYSYAIIGNAAVVFHPDHCHVLCMQQTAKHEEFFCCKWSMDKASGDPLLLLAGKLALIRVINCITNKAVQVTAISTHKSNCHCVPHAAVHEQ